MRLRELLVEEELHPRPVAIVVTPERAVAHAPSGGVEDRLLPAALGLDRVVVSGRDRDARRDGDEPGHQVAMTRGEPQRPRGGVAVGDDDGSGDTGGVEDRAHVGFDLVGSVALDAGEAGQTGRCPARRS